MNFFQAIILGIVQALTEYLPVSSSAHIRIFGDLMLGSDPGAAFTAIIQIGTELAVILYFRHDIINILTHWFSCLFGKNGKTSIEGVYAGGDAVTGAATVILAMGAGKTAAKSIDEYIKSKN